VRDEGEATHKLFLGAEKDSIRNAHGIAKTVGLDGDEGIYLGGGPRSRGCSEGSNGGMH
jgi:hypothetical protein